MIIVPEWLQTWLSKQPEFAMGYQKVTATLDDGSTENGLVFNSQVFLKETEDSSLVVREEWSEVLKEAGKSKQSIASVQLIPRSPETLRGVKRVNLANDRRTILTESHDFAAETEGGPATDAVETPTAAGEVFKRFSAYANDRRVTETKGLTPGTFATTREDADAFVRTGTDAVKRYALENKTPASNVFTIKPPRDTSLKRGIVAPAYGEPGGGVEVIFVNGSPDGTVTGPETIPDK
jgi:hypothetical protein